MKTLILIGYWHSETAPEWPDPAWFVDENMTDTEIKTVSDYLKNACYMPYAAAGLSWCRFRCEERFLGSKELTDGKYLWPEKLWHYVEKHKVRLPDEFISNIMEKREMPTSFEDKFKLNKEWWLNQKGMNQDKSSFLTDR